MPPNIQTSVKFRDFAISPLAFNVSPLSSVSFLILRRSFQHSRLIFANWPLKIETFKIETLKNPLKDLLKSIVFSCKKTLPFRSISSIQELETG